MAKVKRTFDEWKRLVDSYIASLTGGLSGDDLPDVDYTSWYNEGMSPQAAAKKAIRNAKEY